MTAFIIVSAAMLAAAVLWLLVPMWRRAPAAQSASDDDSSSAESAGEGASGRRVASIVTAIGLPVLAIAMYAHVSNWDWSAAARAQAQVAQTDDVLRQLEARLASNPDDAEGWLLLGRSYASLERYARALDAYQQAFDLTKGQNVEAVLGLAEALTLTDQASLNGRAGELFESALALAPNHPKALWYSAIGALQAGNLRLGRDRLQHLLAQNPPEQLRGILQQQIDDLSEQLGEGAATVATETSKPAVGGRAIDVRVTISPEAQAQVAPTTALFVLARAPAGGPPLAVQRHTAQALPLSVQLSEGDAMMPSHSIASVPKVQVVARLSRSGSPQAQSGDLYGEAEFEFGKDSGTLNIIIDRTVP